MTKLRPVDSDASVALHRRGLDLPSDVLAFPITIGPDVQVLGISSLLLDVLRDGFPLLPNEFSAQIG